MDGISKAHIIMTYVNMAIIVMIIVAIVYAVIKKSKKKKLR